MVRLHPLAALLLAAGALGSVGCSSLTEPNDLEVILPEAPAAAPPPAPEPAPAAPAPGGGRRVPNVAPPAGGG